jgi:hypothetical protein
MSGQSASLSLKESKAMQERVQASGSQAKGCGNSKKTSMPESHRKNKKMPKE